MYLLPYEDEGENVLKLPKLDEESGDFFVGLRQEESIMIWALGYGSCAEAKLSSLLSFYYLSNWMCLKLFRTREGNTLNSVTQGHYFAIS